jgi:phage FluMu gp28-like protein
MWVLLSAGERQSKELMGKAAMHARAINQAVRELEQDYWTDKETKYNMLEIAFPNGSRIVGLPANPDTARGWSANIILDEFALHRDSREIWKAMFPTVTRGFKIRVISTFKGKTNKFYELFFGAPTLQSYTGRDYEYKGEKGGWSKHFINIYQAVEMGLELRDDQGKPCEPEDLRLALNDDDAWAEEYECIPSDEVSAFLTHDLISSCEDVKANAAPAWAEMLIKAAENNYAEFRRSKIEPPLPLDMLANVAFAGDLYAGMDIGRKRDLSVIWLDQKIQNVLHPVAVIELKRQPFFIQKQVLHTILARKEMRRICIDETGIGAQLAEGAQDVYGSSRVEGIAFTPESKEAIAVGLKQNLEDRGSVLPASSAIRNSLHSVKKYATTTKHFRFDAERTEATGHADHFWAKGLAVQAASSNVTAVSLGRDPEKKEYMTGRDHNLMAGRGGFFGRFVRKAA